MKIIKSLHPSRDGHLRRKTELIQLVEDMHKEYQSLYNLYDNLRGEVKKKVVHHSKTKDENDEIMISSCSSSRSSVDETYYSPEELLISDTNYEINSDDHKNKNLQQSSETTIPDSEEEEEDGSIGLKDKMASTSELDETLTMASTSSSSRNGGEVLPESMEVIRELRVQVEQSENSRHNLQEECGDLKMKLAKAEEEILLITKNQLDLESKVQSLNLEIETMALNKRTAAMEEEVVEFNKSSNEGYQEKAGLKVLVKDPKKLVVRSLSKKKIDLVEDGTPTTPTMEANDLKFEKDALNKKIVEMETNFKDKENELCTMKLEMNHFREVLESCKAENLELKREKETYFEIKTKQENEQRDLEEIITKLKMEQKQMGILLAQSKSSYQIAEKKIEEMAEDFCKNLEDNLRILSRRIRVAEQMHLENRELYEKTKQGFAKQTKDLKQRAKKNATEIKQIKQISLAANELLSTQDAVALKFEQRTANFLNRISKVSCELKFAKDWVNRRNKSIGLVKDELECLVSQLNDKEAEILVSRKKVWKSENKIRELEKVILEREEGMLSLKEEKREAIRQLCVWIDYHRSRSDYYKKMISEITAGSRKTP